jgi:hypothetical protein
MHGLICLTQHLSNWSSGKDRCPPSIYQITILWEETAPIQDLNNVIDGQSQPSCLVPLWNPISTILTQYLLHIHIYF